MTTRFFFVRDEVTENDDVIYTPINDCIKGWSINRNKTSQDIQSMYNKQKNKSGIVGLLVYKKTGEWTFVEE